MEYEDYLRHEAEQYRCMAEEAKDLSVKQELLALATVCEEMADEAADRLTAG